MSMATELQDVEILQDLLTRYIDSRDGYRQAADLILDSGLAQAFEHIAARRQATADKLAILIREAGVRPDSQGSTEAGMYRWWGRIRDCFNASDTSTILHGCLRNERELARALQAALDTGELSSRHSSLVADVHAEAEAAIQAFEGLAGPT